MANFALLNFSDSGVATPGLRVGDAVLSVADGLRLTGQAPSPAYATTKDILGHWAAAEPVLEKIADGVEQGGEFAKAAKPLSSVKLMAPILYPDAILCAFANYTDHMKEMSDRSPPDKTKVNPLFFFKHPRSVIGPEDTVQLPAFSKQVDWEAELAVVIGDPARNVAVENAMKHVAGYTIINDLSLRDQGNRPDWNMRHDFLSGKSFDTGAPMGPWIVPAKQIPDIYNLSLKQWIAGELMQDSSTSYIHFTIAELIAYLSAKFTLHPGDVIATGSPSGNGRPRGIFLAPGQDLTIEIEGIGRLHNPILQGV
ncbi:MAG TPA: fumarylacetoacetate hydrolase family protein [Alphaproteobacteria bacterium]|jgi:2-keto-4-pentenoate hydratase/2-oxohepta-3-ene-1,7-dioic acid hydratase in catechol pathway